MIIQQPNRTAYRVEMILSGVFLFACLVCFIVNYSIDRFFSWSLYPAGALFMIWATITPFLLLQKNRTEGSFIALSVTLIPFLLLVQWLVPAKGWFLPLALPLALLVLAGLGICLFAFRFIKNKLYTVAVAIFVFGVVVNYGVGIFVKNYLPYSGVDEVSRISTMAAAGILSLLLAVVGSLKTTVRP
ncbi:DUF6320 domain-containing protein [Ferruginibacter paludis]|uniref:DUF6320 domain-containing protein n=1 Tax=Ferruginibacter paludis TaxID=1310417 RepID=UPI0025B3E1A7|nr:DUF6320 domain-containing protein [Ferruginibacter paludis]MDN3655733.1 DUF6320 domain-containing protein [Ferruginibacter paludis]